ncbi:golgin subfamily A member 6-like protein 6 [Asparagus officinalis]|uniref:golgin subfamily A member 6-like protein 6 n=1 Tax=Asparagus officinalis TaxID=4686 RepID=UPI00098E7CAE|nr:golgin subfamily A member 6-like protein 6 [Asparagus officinalis]
MTGIRKPALNIRWKPPLTNWVRVGGTAGSMRRETIVSKAEKATIKIKDKPESTNLPAGGKYPQREPSGKNISSARLGKKRIPAVSDKSKAMVVSLPRVKEKKQNVKDEKQARIVSQHIKNALDKEDEIEKLSLDQQIQFWRNTTKLNMKLLHATKRSKRLQWDACSKEIHRLNRKLEFYEGTADLIDPQDLKKSVEEIMSKSDRHTRAAHVKRKRSVDSIGKAQAEQEGDSVGQDEDEETGGEYKEEEMEDREHEEKEEDREQALSEGDREQENREEDREQVVVEQEDSLQENKLVDSSASEKVEVREEYFEVEVREQEMKVHEKEEELAQMFEEEKEEEKGSAEKV